MASTDPEIKNGFSLPVWMKAKGTKDFESFATSPPAPEDSFFFIKYPKTEVIFGKPTVEQESQFQNVVREPSDGVKSAHYHVQEKDWSKHTKPCQEVLQGTAGAIKPTKPMGTDDGFKGEGAACGNSIVKVAHQMIQSNRPASRGFTVASPTEDPVESEAREQYHMTRRGSKSLPVTPAHSPPSSPNSRRKKTGNRFFTSPFEPAADSGSRSWLTTALLGLQRDLSASSSTLVEEDAIEARLQGATLAESVENLGPSPRMKDQKLFDSESMKPKPMAAQAFRPKPSELREMNFWSPTSM